MLERQEGLSQPAAPKVKLLRKTEKQTANHHSMGLGEAGVPDRTLTLPQRKGVRKRNKPPVNKQSKKPPPKWN
jgi:hypothetical protein